MHPNRFESARRAGAPAVPGDRKGRPYGKTVSYMFVGAVINRPRRNRFGFGETKGKFAVHKCLPLEGKVAALRADG